MILTRIVLKLKKIIKEIYHNNHKQVEMCKDKDI